MRSALKFCWLLTLSLSLWSPDARAQKPDEPEEPVQESAQESVEESASPPQAKPWQIEEIVRPTAPDVYLLPDAAGKLRKVLGFRYEDFFEAWKRDESAAVAAPPRYVLDAWDVTGDVSETHARLRIEFEITIQAAGWIDIPIQLPKFIVQQLTIDDQVEGECLVFDKQRHGHVIWLTGKVGQKRKLTLAGLTKLKLNPGNFGLELHLPRATTSQFLLRVPGSSLRFESSPELTLTSMVKEDSTEVRLLGQANPLRLNWIPAEEPASNQSANVEVEGQTTIRFERRRVLYDATLQITSLAENPLVKIPLEKIQMRLPPFAKLNQGQVPGGYEIQEISVASEQDPRSVVEIRRSVPSQKPWVIRLSAERPLESFSGSAKYEVEGFEVPGAFRQSGTVTLEVNKQLQAYFDTYGDIDQTPLQKTASTAEGSAILGQFRYTRFPWQLVVHTSPRQRRVSLKPKYHLTLNSEEARLEVEYDYQLTGVQIFSLRVNLQGWKRTEAPIESGGLVDSDGVIETSGGQLVLPLVDAETKQLRLNLSLRKDIQLGENTFFLPEPLGAFVVEGDLRVDSTEALRVTPKLEEMTGLSIIAKTETNSLSSVTPDATAEQDQINLRTFLARPKFVAEVAQRLRQVIATEQTQVEINRQTIQVRQQINYQAKYQPVSQLVLSLPESLWTNDSLAVTLAGEPLPFGLGSQEEDLANEEAGIVTSERQIIVSLPRPMQGEIPIELVYELPTPKLLAEELTPVLLPLASPSDRVSRHEAVINTAQPIFVTLNQRSASGAWTVVPKEDVAEGSTTMSSTNLLLQTGDSPSFLSLYAQLDSTDQEQRATLERAWIQSWITKDQRQDRAVFRFRTTHPTVFVQLPLALEIMEIEVLLDGSPWQHESVSENRLAIILPTEGQLASHTLELRYQTAATLPSWGKLQSLLPRLECRLASAPIYWQLILPRGWQVASSPEQLLPDYWLGWKNYRWGRQPSLAQADFERMTDAAQAPAPTPLSAQYVYRAFEIPATIEVVVLRQVWLLLGGALAAFGLGLLALHTPIARSGLFWFGLALALLVGIFSYPEMMLLAIQVVLAGGLMTFATNLLRRVFVKDESRSLAATSFPTHGSSIDATEPWQPQQPLGDSPSSSEMTATMRTGRPTS